MDVDDWEGFLNFAEEDDRHQQHNDSSLLEEGSHFTPPLTPNGRIMCSFLGTPSDSPSKYRNCINCQADSTPFWRKSPNNPGKYFCNACGLYFRAHQSHRPVELTARVPDRLSNIRSHAACQDCGTTDTPLWRRNSAGQTVCNACGLRARHQRRKADS